ncbi:hypothetical protein, partial [Bacillus cereus]|uniref:hypothetical protein n=1 Tax=Bacillus cereus TaxID=1396 RepID=UPI001A7E2B0A
SSFAVLRFLLAIRVEHSLAVLVVLPELPVFVALLVLPALLDLKDFVALLVLQALGGLHINQPPRAFVGGVGVGGVGGRRGG